MKWSPGYLTTYTSESGQPQDIVVGVDDVMLDECPTSIKARHPEMEVLASEVLNFASIREASGAIPFGSDSNKWPAKWHDIVLASRNEERRVEIARDEWRNRMRSAHG